MKIKHDNELIERAFNFFFTDNASGTLTNATIDEHPYFKQYLKDKKLIDKNKEII